MFVLFLRTRTLSFVDLPTTAFHGGKHFWILAGVNASPTQAVFNNHTSLEFFNFQGRMDLRLPVRADFESKRGLFEFDQWNTRKNEGHQKSSLKNRHVYMKVLEILIQNMKTLTLSRLSFLPVTYLKIIPNKNTIVSQQLATDVILIENPTSDVYLWMQEKEVRIRGYLEKPPITTTNTPFLCQVNAIPREIRWFDDLSITHHTVDIHFYTHKFAPILSAPFHYHIDTLLFGYTQCWDL